MNSDHPKRESMSIEEATIFTMWEIPALVEVLEHKGICTKEELWDTIADLRKKNPRARSPDTAFPSPCLLSQTEERVIDHLLAVLNQYGMDSQQSLELSEQLGRILEMGARLARKTTH